MASFPPTAWEATQGDEIPPVLPDQKNINITDIHVQRAAVCCSATSCNVQAVEALEEFGQPDLGFKKVYISQREPKRNSLIALAIDDHEVSVCVAFGAKCNPEEILGGSCIPTNDSIWLSYLEDEEFEEALAGDGCHCMNFVPAVAGLVEFCGGLAHALRGELKVERRSCPLRLIFCGEGLGGVVSHVMAFTTRLAILPHRINSLENSCISITFGSPFLSDNRAHSFLKGLTSDSDFCETPEGGIAKVTHTDAEFRNKVELIHQVGLYSRTHDLTFFQPDACDFSNRDPHWFSSERTFPGQVWSWILESFWSLNRAPPAER